MDQIMEISVQPYGHINLYRSSEGAASIDSSLKREGERQGDTQEQAAYDAALDGLEAMLLALYAAGVNFTQEQAEEAVRTAIEGIGNNI